MCKTLALIYVKVLSIFLELENARPRSTSGIQALCSLHIALEKEKMAIQHCAECRKIYLDITGNSVVLKFEKARSALEDGLKRVEEIVPTNYRMSGTYKQVFCRRFLLEVANWAGRKGWLVSRMCFFIYGSK
ncbi:U-box domain-containing protein 6-like isoform X2 [Rutidosis leptorrhynchoides]